VERREGVSERVDDERGAEEGRERTKLTRRSIPDTFEASSDPASSSGTATVVDTDERIEDCGGWRGRSVQSWK